jgi:prevent-host-death family protein
MDIYNMHDAKTNLSRLIDESVKRGEPFIIAKSGKPLVKVVPIDAETAAPLKRIGFMKGQMIIPIDFDTMGADEISGIFDGSIK